MSKQLEGLISRRAADLSVLDTLVEGEGGVGRSGWDRMEKGPGRIFIRDRSQETLLCAPVFLSSGKDPGLFKGPGLFV